MTAAKIISIWKKYRRNMARDSCKRVENLKLGNKERAKRLASESHKIMCENFELGYVCVVERCYILIGVQHENLSLTFSALQNLIEVDEVNLEEGSIDLLNRRHWLLADIQSKVILSSEDALVSYPKSELQCLNREKVTKEISLQDPLPDIKHTLPLPRVTNEWGLARLIIRIKLP